MSKVSNIPLSTLAAVGSLFSPESSEDGDDFLGVVVLEFPMLELSLSGEVGTEIIGEDEEVDEMVAWPILLTEEFFEVIGKALLLHEILGILELCAENPLERSKDIYLD